jgi:sugar lactone lactonase YvrE
LAVAAVGLPDGRTLLATGDGDGTVRLWDPVTGDSEALPFGSEVRSLCAVGVGRLAVGLDDGVAVVDAPRESGTSPR